MMRLLFCFCIFVSCSPSKDFNTGEFDRRLNALKKNINIDSTEVSLANSIFTLESLIKQEITYLDSQDLLSSHLINLSSNLLREHYSKSIFPTDLAKNLNFIDSIFLLKFPGYKNAKHQFSPRWAYETSGIKFETEFFLETQLDVDMQQQFLFGLLSDVKRNEKDFYLFLKSKEN